MIFKKKTEKKLKCKWAFFVPNRRGMTPYLGL